MKLFTKYFLIIIAGVFIGYAWAASCYLPKINAYKASLATYQDYINKK